MAEAIVAEVGGAETASVLFKGKIVGVERTLRMGHAYGEVIIEGDGDGGAKEKLVIPFKNENIYAKKVYSDGREEVCLPSHVNRDDANGQNLDRRHRTRPSHRARRAERRSIGDARLSLWLARECDWYYSVGKVDFHSKRS
jgi:hypothetical protein